MSEHKAYWPFFLIDFDLCFCLRSADVMPITKIHFVRKARNYLWITGKVRRKNSPCFCCEPTIAVLTKNETGRIAANIAKLPGLLRKA